VGFLRHLIGHVPYRIHTLLIDNGIQFANQERHKWAFKLLFDRVCDQHQIEHRLTKLKHPWTNGQVERMNRTLKEATVHHYHYDTYQTFQEHLAAFVMAYNLAKRLKTLKGLTPYEFICQQWQQDPDRFMREPYYLTLELNI
jgi:transposase InsO family protein